MSIWRIIICILGLLFTAIALSADWTGLDSSDSFGAGETLILLLGVTILTAGIAGRKFIRIYKNSAIILLNLIIVIIFLEAGSIAVMTLINRSATVAGFRMPIEYTGLPYYKNQAWSESYWRELGLAGKTKYVPYTLWRRHAFKGEFINIDNNGLRSTPGARCTEKSLKIFAFGGSAMWGWGAPDWGTIPAFLQTGLQVRVKQPVCVTNFAATAYVSSQALIELIKQLQNGNIPDIAIFYDGVNDVLAAYQTGAPNNHQNLHDLSLRFENTEHSIMRVLKTSNLLHLTRQLKSRESTSCEWVHGKDTKAEILSDSVYKTYLANARIIDALARKYGFQYYLFWQPVITAGNKQLTEEEMIIKSKLPPLLTDLYAEI
jgi:hypothetical protein